MLPPAAGGALRLLSSAHDPRQRHRPPCRRPGVRSAESIRLDFADAWGEMGAAWGVPPSVARVHGYILTHPGPLTEREVREALGLSHRAASMALAECEAWGLIERIPDPVRVGRRGPSAIAYVKVGDHWVWFQRIAEQRKQRETDPVLPLIEAATARADAVAMETPDDREVIALRDWLRICTASSASSTGRWASSRGQSRRRSPAASPSWPGSRTSRSTACSASSPSCLRTNWRTLDAISRVSPTTARRVLQAAGRGRPPRAFRPGVGERVAEEGEDVDPPDCVRRISRPLPSTTRHLSEW